VIEIILLIALAGSFIAGLWDLRTTEVPDELLYLMVTAGIFFWYINAGLTNDFYPLFVSLSVGTVSLVLGIALYKTGKWGGADAWMFAAIAYLVPVYGNNNFFISYYFFNLLFVSLAYMIIYSIALGLKHRAVFSYLNEDLKKNWHMVCAAPVAFLAIFVIMQLLMMPVLYAPFVMIFVLIAFLSIFWRYALIIEKRVFVRRVPAKNLKTGDVLVDMKWVGLTEKEVKEIKKRKKYVTIKEGVRFTMVFFITLVVTLLFGNLLMSIIY
jgi:Flp pilus assembly protein protease CpaA